MPATFRPLLLAACASALLLFAPASAQQAAPSAGPVPPGSAPQSPAGAASGKPEPASAPDSGLTSPADIAQKLIAAAITAKDPATAMNDLTQAIKLSPNSSAAYVLRGSIYYDRKQWPQAEADFRAALRLAPQNPVLKVQLIEIKFRQKQYDTARIEYAALESDPDMGDFASYKVFLCDLLGGHEAQARKELDVFNDKAGDPSYFFANAAWSLYHKNTEDARGWLLSASHIYPLRKNIFYSQSLRDLGYLPLPPAKE